MNAALRATQQRFQRRAALLLAESSTLRGAVQLAILAAGYHLNPEQMERSLAAAVIVGAVLKTVLPDRWTNPAHPANVAPLP